MKEACSFVNLKFEELYNKYPFELSGGQMQRLMIARIFMLHPKVLIADEPTSMVDACSRSTILDMLLKLRDENRMTIVFITHDVGLAYYVSDTICIMEHGRMVEAGRAEEVIHHAEHPYTKQLINDVPKIHSPGCSIDTNTQIKPWTVLSGTGLLIVQDERFVLASGWLWRLCRLC